MDVGVQFFLFFRSFHQLGRFGTLINRNGKKKRGTAGVFFVFLCRSANSWFGNEIYPVTNRRIEIRDKIPIPNGTTYFDCRGIPKPNQYCFSLLKSDNLFFFCKDYFLLVAPWGRGLKEKKKVQMEKLKKTNLRPVGKNWAATPKVKSCRSEDA